MAVIEYTCDTCNRKIDITQNKHGLDIIQKCIITDGCHGKLSQTKYKQDYIRGKFPSKVSNLNDYSARKILYNHTQSIKLLEWKITHNLGVAPLTNIFIERPKIIENLSNTNLENSDNLIELIEVTPVYIRVISANEILVGFDRPEKGKAQLLSKTSSKIKTKSKMVDETLDYIQISNSSVLSIATLNHDTYMDIEISYMNPLGMISIQSYDNVNDNPNIISPWSDYDKIYLNGLTYTVRSINILNTDIENGSSFMVHEKNILPGTDNGLLLLYSKYPFESSDKILNSLGDISTLTIENSTNHTLYKNGDLFLNQTEFTSVYPYIKKV